MKKYRRITYTDRLVIEKLYNSGCSYRAISRKLGFSPSAIHYEVQRGLYDHLDGKTYSFIKRYSATIADDDATFQASSKGSLVKLGKRYDYARFVASRIKAGESPDQIVGFLKINQKWTVSTPTLYRYIEQGFIPGITNKNLLVKSQNKKREYNKPRAAKAPKGPSIERRPASVSDRLTPGHWEMDTVIGKAKGPNQSCLVLTERKTRFEIIVKLPNKTAASVLHAVTNTVEHFPSGTFQTITVDNGSEFAAYDGLKQLVQEVYYCHPYCSCERGSNENANRLIRRHFPKGHSMAKVTQRDCDAAAYHLNHMHRKILGYKTAADLFEAWQSTLTGTP